MTRRARAIQRHLQICGIGPRRSSTSSASSGQRGLLGHTISQTAHVSICQSICDALWSRLPPAWPRPVPISAVPHVQRRGRCLDHQPRSLRCLRMSLCWSHKAAGVGSGVRWLARMHAVSVIGNNRCLHGYTYIRAHATRARIPRRTLPAGKAKHAKAKHAARGRLTQKSRNAQRATRETTSSRVTSYEFRVSCASASWRSAKSSPWTASGWPAG